MLIVNLTKLAEADCQKLDATRLNQAIAMLDELRPQGGAEAMLAAQMVAVHDTAMKCLARANLEGQTFEGRELNLKHAAKLTRIYAQQVETLAKHQRKGRQTVIVEHVHVHKGGQAIVGTVSTGRGLDEKSAEQPNAPSP